MIEKLQEILLAITGFKDEFNSMKAERDAAVVERDALLSEKQVAEGLTEEILAKLRGM